MLFGGDVDGNAAHEILLSFKYNEKPTFVQMWVFVWREWEAGEKLVSTPLEEGGLPNIAHAALLDRKTPLKSVT